MSHITYIYYIPEKVEKDNITCFDWMIWKWWSITVFQFFSENRQNMSSSSHQSYIVSVSRCAYWNIFVVSVFDIMRLHHLHITSLWGTQWLKNRTVEQVSTPQHLVLEYAACMIYSHCDGHFGLRLEAELVKKEVATLIWHVGSWASCKAYGTCVGCRL